MSPWPKAYMRYGRVPAMRLQRVGSRRMTPEQREKRRLRAQQWKAANREHLRAKGREYYARHREHRLEQNRATAIAYYHANLEERREAVKQYHATHKEERAAYRKRYRQANREKLQERRRQAYQKTREADLERARVQRLLFPEKFQQRDRAQRQRHRGRISMQTQKRRALLYAAPRCDLTLEQWHLVQEAQHHCCAYCGKKAKGTLTRDHITPLSHQGPHTLHNIVAACHSCNSRKRTGPPLKPVQPLLL